MGIANKVINFIEMAKNKKPYFISANSLTLLTLKLLLEIF